jgi:hypothetical protein
MCCGMHWHQHLGFLLDDVGYLYARRFEEHTRELSLTCLLVIAVDRLNRSAAPTKLPDSTICRNTFMLRSVSILDIVYTEKIKALRVSIATLPRTDRENNSGLVDAAFLRSKRRIGPTDRRNSRSRTPPWPLTQARGSLKCGDRV